VRRVHIDISAQHGVHVGLIIRWFGIDLDKRRIAPSCCCHFDVAAVFLNKAWTKAFVLCYPRSSKVVPEVFT
jgi:hypothetical protein